MNKNIKVTTHINNNAKSHKNLERHPSRTNTTRTNRVRTNRISNWSEYNQALTQRGNISIYVSDAITNKVFTRPEPSHEVGHPIQYKDDLVQFILTLRELFHLPLRQTIGFVSGLLKSMGLDWQLPDYTTLSRRMSRLDIKFCQRFNGKNIVLLLDSSGFKVYGEGEWKVRKHGIGYRRTWQETHIAVDWKTRNIVGLVNTRCNVHDNTQVKPLLDSVKRNLPPMHRISTVIGDGAYDARENYLIARKLGSGFIAPPRKDATEHINMYHYQIYDTPGWEERNTVIRQIEEWGLDGWKANANYHRRSLVENSFYRLKTIFGGNLKSRTTTNQYTEQCIRASLINRFNDIGLPRYNVV